ncbi:MAG: hypothetical protein SCH39_02545 [Methanosarcinales archaeon]|nr:hypothetical protein [Methanosarcinales archaeon]
MIDSGKQIDLNGDGIIEMGEENYYTTDPNEYTYIVDVFVVVDEEYKEYYNLAQFSYPWQNDRWKDITKDSIDEAGNYFLNTYQIKLNISHIDGNWDSDDGELGCYQLLKEVMDEKDWIGTKYGTDNYNSDILLAFTGQDKFHPYMFNRSFGMAFDYDAAAIVKIPSIYSNTKWEIEDPIVNLIQHEVSHLFGAPDHYDDRFCVMDKTWPWPIGEGVLIGMGNLWTTHMWDDECYDIIESNKSEVALFKDGGEYDINN